jgi:hypothetical protein
MQELRRVAAPEAARRTDLAAAGDAVAEIYAGFVVAGTAFEVVLQAAFSLDGIVPAAALQCVTFSAAGQLRGAALPWVLRTFNLEFAPISHYGERKGVASKYEKRASSASLVRRSRCTKSKPSRRW